MTFDKRFSLGHLAREVATCLRTAQRASLVAHLFELSDAELAARGLSRDRVFASVFRG